MSRKCVAISCCLSFLAISISILVFGTFFDSLLIGDNNENGGATLTMYPEDVSEPDYTVKCSLSEPAMWTPSMQSFIQATAKGEDQQLLLNGLAVYSNLANACQPLEDVSKAKIQVHKVALVTLRNSNYTLCPFKNLIVSAQNAGYSVLIYFTDKQNNILLTKDELTVKKLLIPALYADDSSCMQIEGSAMWSVSITSSTFSLANSDQRAVKIRVPPWYSPGLEKMQSYLSNLYFWFFVGPIITLEWLRRTKKFCWMSGGQQNETNEIQNMEEAANSNESLPHGTYDVGQPLLSPVNSTEYTTIPRYVNSIVEIGFPFKLAVLVFYVIFIIAALPVGISSGGWSFFRFDEDNVKRPTSYLINLYHRNEFRYLVVQYRISTLWSPIQVFCFFMYSRFACKTTWTVQTNFSKLIRSDWFASNIYLLVLGIVVPYCSAPNFPYYATYNTLCTVCNGLFIIILNKHKFVTRYVFYISVCMIFAYLESDVVAVFYFVLNSQGSLNNLKLTALRTVAIGLTLSISFSSSMHIIRKLVKPEESLFKGLSEK